MRTLLLFALMLGLVTGIPFESAYAYGGPGSVLSGIGTLLAALAAIIASLFGFIWFPLKRLLRKFREDEATAPAEADPAGE
ncbi:hypothetical protein BSZ35_14370 [Salinibacter sp. 10B]|nr:hypothetical protein BSZ35_14370 [Salinibacter sp. 10B]